MFYSAVICIKKSEKKQNVVEWGIMTFMIVLCYHAFVAALINLTGIPIGLLSIGTADVLLGVLLWLKIIKTKERQQYYFRKRDILAVLCMAVVLGLSVLHQFGSGLHLNYISTDGVTHFRMALKVIERGWIEKMFFAPLNNALFLELCIPVLGTTRLYQAFVFLDALVCLLGGAVFYCIINCWLRGRGAWIVGTGISLFYMMGYPRNGLVYGFNYLGVSVLLILFLVWVLQNYLNKNINKKFSICLLSGGCYGVGVCYSLFAPVVYFAVCGAVSVDIWRNAEKGSKVWIKDFILTNLKIFLIPCILVFVYSFVGYFMPANSGATISEGIAEAGNDLGAEGAIYRDLFSNFVFWLPFALFGIIQTVKQKRNDLMVYYFILLSVFSLALGYGGMKMQVSSYYFYKNHFFMAPVLFYFAVYGILELLKEYKAFVLSAVVVFAGLGIATITNLELSIQKRNMLFAPVSKSGYYFDVYTTNYQLAENQEDYPEEKIQLFSFFDEEFPKEKTENIIVCSQVPDANVFCAITRRLDRSDFIYWYDLSEEELKYYDQFTEKEKKKILMKDNKIDFKGYHELMQDSSRLEDEMPFIYLYDTEEEYEDLMQLKGNDLEILYENEAGFVAIMENCRD